jgi:hypothetical protein
MKDEQESEGDPQLLPAAKRGGAAADGPFTPTPPPFLRIPMKQSMLGSKQAILDARIKDLRNCGSLLLAGALE